jgi:hypothetical protein
MYLAGFCSAFTRVHPQPARTLCNPARNRAIHKA